MIADKIYTTDEMVDAGIYTTDFVPMDKPGEYTGQLLLRGSSRRGMLRLFFLLEDGRKIITPVFKWQRFLGFFHIPNGTVLKLTYVNGRDNMVYLQKAVRTEMSGTVLASNVLWGHNTESADANPLVRENPETPEV